MSSSTHLGAANAADDNYFLISVNMAVGAYTLDETVPPTEGARHVTLTHSTNGSADTLGTVELVGTDLSGQTITETLTPSAGGVVTSTAWFRTLTSATGVGWVTDGTADDIELGYGADICVLDGVGRLEAIIVNTTAAATIVVADSGGTIATLAASIPVGHYEYGLDVSNLTLDLNGASDVTVIHSPSLPKTYALA